MDSMILMRRFLLGCIMLVAAFASVVVARAQAPVPDAKTASAVQRATASLLTDKPCSQDRSQSWVEGFRTLYCSISPTLGMSQVEQLSGVRIFLSGPHDRQPNWKANTFGRYNPAFVTWAAANLLPEKSAIAQQAYDRFGRLPARTLLVAYVRLKTNSAELNGLANQYRRGSPANLSPYYQNNLDRDPDIRAVMENGDTSSYIFSTVMGFWARREVDGTSALFYAGLQKTLERFDADFLRRRDLRDATAASSAGTTPAPKPIADQQAANAANVTPPVPQNIGCIPLSAVRNTYTPPDLYRAVTECLAKGNYELALRLFMLAGTYASFDAERITDKTGAQAKTVLVTNTLINEPEEKKAKLGEIFSQISNDPAALGRLCGEVQRVDMPNYYPAYMIQHGIIAYTGNNPNDGALVQNFDAPGTWKRVQTAYLNCPS